MSRRSLLAWSVPALAAIVAAYWVGRHAAEDAHDDRARREAEHARSPREGSIAPHGTIAPRGVDPRTPISVVRVRGRLYDRLTNAEIAGARLSIEGERKVELASGTSAIDGRFDLPLDADRVDGARLLRVDVASYVERVEPVARPDVAGVVDVGNLFLDARTSERVALRGRVTDEVGRALANAIVYVGSDALYPLADARKVGATDEEGRIVLDAPIARSDRHVVQHVFAMTRERVAFAKLSIPPRAAEVDLSELRAVPDARVVVDVLGDGELPIANVVVEACARFYPFSGLFDATQPGVVPLAEIAERFRARTNGAGRATFEHLPWPLASSVYELVVDAGGLGRGSLLLESAPDASDEPSVLRVAP